MPLGASIYPDVYVRPSRAEIVFSSSDESVFVVMGSQIKSLGEGEALLTASSLDGTVSASCVVKVDRSLGIGSFTVNPGGKTADLFGRSKPAGCAVRLARDL